MEKSDQQIISDFINGDKSSFEILVDRHLKMVYNFVLRMSGNTDEAYDLTQEVFIKLWKNIKKYDSKKNFKTWILTISRNVTIDWFRKKRPYTFSDLDVFGDTDSGSTFEENLPDPLPLADKVFEQKELAEKTEKILSTLSPDLRSIIFMHDFESLTFEEIAEIIQKPMNTVKSQYRRALHQIATLYRIN